MNGIPGLYWMDLRGGEPHRIAAAGETPLFSPDDKRAYHTVSTYTDHDLITSLESVDLSGQDKRTHVPDTDADTSELRISPDLHWARLSGSPAILRSCRTVETGTALQLDTAVAKRLLPG